MRVWPTSVRTTLTLWYTVVLALPLVAFAVVSYLAFSDTVHDRTDAFLADALGVFAEELAAERRAAPEPEGVMRRTLRELRFQEIDLVILDEAGAVVGVSTPRARPGSDAPPVEPNSAATVALLPAAAALASSAGTVTSGGRAYRVLERAIVADGRAFTLVGVHRLDDVEATLRRIRRLYLVAIPLIIVCAAVGGSFLARRSFRPVTSMAARAAEIGANTLHERLPVVADDELGDLARVLNDLLDRLGRSFEQQRRFMTDASHELRTPTAIVRAEADVTLSRDARPEEEYRASMEIVQGAARRLTRIVDDVFLIARSDAGHVVMRDEPLYLDDLVRDTVRTATPIADARSVRVELGEVAESPMIGDPDLLGRLILNLLDNAIKHSPEGCVIEVSLRECGASCRLSVVDAGPGIPEDGRERVFERFFRLDEARSRHGGTLTSGAGLGLSICRAIADLHGGRLDLIGSRPGRTEFRATMPLTDLVGRANGT